MSEFTKEDIDQWSEEYDALINTPPEEGDILQTADGSPAVLAVDKIQGAPPFIYGKLYVPEVVGDPLGWFLQSKDGLTFHGWKCILMPRARAEIIAKFGVGVDVIEVTSLKMIRKSGTGKSLLCEVHKYCEEEVVEDPVVAEVAEEVIDYPDEECDSSIT